MRRGDRFDGLKNVVPEVLAQRELLGLAAARHTANRHRRSALGLAWVLLNPLLTACVMFAVFRTLFRAGDVGQWPFLAYVYAGVVTWQCFAQTVLEIGPSLRANAGILTRTPAAPEVFVLSAVASGLVGYLAGGAILLAILVIAGAIPPATVLLVPFVMLSVGLLALGVGAILAQFSIVYEDVGSLTTVALSLLSYLTPTFYPVSIIPDRWRWLYDLNPMVALLDLYRSAFGYPSSVGIGPKVYALLLGPCLAALGLHTFRRRWPRVVTEL